MRFIKQSKGAWRIWHERRLETEAEERIIENIRRISLGSSTALLASITLIMHGLFSALPFVVLALFLYIKK